MCKLNRPHSTCHMRMLRAELLNLEKKRFVGIYQCADRWGFRSSQFKPLLLRAGSAVRPDRLIRTISEQSCKPQRIQSALCLSRKPVTLLDCHYREKSFSYTWYKHLVPAYTQCFSLRYRTGQAFHQPLLTGQVLQPLTTMRINLANSLICPVLEMGQNWMQFQTWP